MCNALGTSRKKHKITAVYWVLANVPPLLRSSLTSIYLAILCKADDVEKFGYSAVLEPLLKDLSSLEEEGLYIPSLGIRVKGIVYCVVADNLGAHYRRICGELLKYTSAGSVLEKDPSSK